VHVCHLTVPDNIKLVHQHCTLTGGILHLVQWWWEGNECYLGSVYHLSYGLIGYWRPIHYYVRTYAKITKNWRTNSLVPTLWAPIAHLLFTDHFSLVVQVEQSVEYVRLSVSSNNFRNDLWPRYLACWFILTLARSSSRSFIMSKFKVAGGRCFFFRLWMRIARWRIHSESPEGSIKRAHCT